MPIGAAGATPQLLDDQRRVNSPASSVASAPADRPSSGEMRPSFHFETMTATIIAACLSAGVVRADNLDAKIAAFQRATESRTQQEIDSLCTERFSSSVYLRDRCVNDQQTSRTAVDSITANRIRFERSADPSDKKTAVTLKRIDRECAKQSYDQHVRTDWTVHYNCMQGKLSFYAPR